MKPARKSATLFAKAKTLFPGGVNSPVRAFKAVGGTPHFIARASGARITDIDGNTFIDYVGSWGPMIHGHAPRGLAPALAKQAKLGTSFGAPSPLEVELAGLRAAARAVNRAGAVRELGHRSDDERARVARGRDRTREGREVRGLLSRPRATRFWCRPAPAR